MQTAKQPGLEPVVYGHCRFESCCEHRGFDSREALRLCDGAPFGSREASSFGVRRSFPERSRLPGGRPLDRDRVRIAGSSPASCTCSCSQTGKGNRLRLCHHTGPTRERRPLRPRPGRAVGIGCRRSDTSGHPATGHRPPFNGGDRRRARRPDNSPSPATIRCCSPPPSS